MKLAPLALALGLLALPATLASQVTVVSNTLDQRTATAGERYTGTIRLVNTGSGPEQARVYPTDYRFLADGQTFYDAPGNAARSNAAWITFSPSALTLAPGQEATVTYTVQVPAGDLRGSYWSVLMVEGVRPVAAQARAGRVELSPTVRYAVQVATHVGQARRQIALQGARVVREGGAALQVDVVNAGEQADKLELRVDVFDADGSPVARLSAERGVVYPGSSIRHRFDLGGLRPGTYRAMLVVDTGGDDVFGAEYTLQI